MNPGASSPCVFLSSDVDGTGSGHADDFVIVTRRCYVKEFVKYLRNKLDVEVQAFGSGDDDGI